MVRRAAGYCGLLLRVDPVRRWITMSLTRTILLYPHSLATTITGAAGSLLVPQDDT